MLLTISKAKFDKFQYPFTIKLSASEEYSGITLLNTYLLFITNPKINTTIWG